MFRALWVKHWVQLRTLRWVGFGLCVVLPFFLWTGAAAAKRGWFPFSLGNYSLTTLFGEALPGFSVLLWALLAVMFAAQTFAGDRADGTDRFLLERPVPRGSVWRARVLASLVSALCLALANTIYLFALVAIIDDGSVADVFGGMALACAVGFGLTLLGTLGGMAAGEMVRTPMQGVLIGLVLAALPIGVTTLLSSVFEFVRFTRVLHLAWFVAPILPIVLVFASYRAGCLGEPSGRGRIKRGLAVLAVGLVLTPALFAAATPFVLRAVVTGAWAQGVAATADRAILVGGDYGNNGGWMVDTATAKKTRFLPPPVHASGWNADGSIAAVIHQSGAFGSSAPPKLEFIDASGRTLSSLSIRSQRHFYIRDLYWAGDIVLVREWVGAAGARIRGVHPERGEVGTIEMAGGKGQAWSLHGPAADGTVYLYRLTWDGEAPRHELAPLDLKSFVIGEPVLTEVLDLPTFAPKMLSPSGRYWARFQYNREDESSSSYVVDLQTGERRDYAESMVVGWLEGDVLVRLDRYEEWSRVLVESVADGVLSWKTYAPGISVRVSPDQRRFFVARGGSDQREFAFPYDWGSALTHPDSLAVCGEMDCTDLDSLVEELQRDRVDLSWGGPNTLVAHDANGTAVAEVKPGARWTALIGRWN